MRRVTAAIPRDALPSYGALSRCLCAAGALIMVAVVAGCGGLGPEGADPVDAAGKATAQLNESISTVTTAIADRDRGRLTAMALSGFQTEDVELIIGQYGGRSVEEVPSELQWDHAGEVSLGFRVSCSPSKSVVFQLEFVVDGSTWRPVLGPPTAAAEERASREVATDQIGGPPAASSAGATPQSTAASPPQYETYRPC